MSDDELRSRYLGVGGFVVHSMAELARLLGVQRRTVRRRLRAMGVRLRLPAEARDLSPRRAGWTHSPEARAKMGAGVRAWWDGLSPADRERVSAVRRSVWWGRPPSVGTRMRARAARARKGRLRQFLRAALVAAGETVLDGERGGADMVVVAGGRRWAVLADGFWRLQMPVERVLARVERCRLAGAAGVVRVCHDGRKTRPPAAELLARIHKIVYDDGPTQFTYHELDYVFQEGQGGSGEGANGGGDGDRGG